MKRALILCLALAAATAAAAQPDALVRTYSFRHLDALVVEALFWDLCEEQGDAHCAVVFAAGDQLQARAGNPVQRRMARLLAERDVLPPSQRLQVHLLTAATGESAIPERLGAGPRRALEDLAAVLGSRRFELLDSALLETTEHASTHLAGPGGVVLDAELRVREIGGLDNEKLLVDVRLTVPGRGEQTPAEGQPHLRPGSLLATSLSLDAGETVVVGTSRLDGADQGLVLLLTALP